MKFTVRKDQTVTPATPQRGGIYGDHNRLTVTFELDFDNATFYQYRVEAVNGAGAYDFTDFLPLDPKTLSNGNHTVSLTVPCEWTVAGLAALRLVGVKIVNYEETERFHSEPAYLYFEGRDNGEALWEATKGAWQAVIQKALEAADRAEKGDTGDAGVYYGEQPPTDASHPLWIYTGDEPIETDDAVTWEQLESQGYTTMAEVQSQNYTTLDEVKGGMVYIVESGTSGMWHYKKYSDGTVECYGVDCRPLATTMAKGSLYYSDDVYIDLPFKIQVLSVAAAAADIMFDVKAWCWGARDGDTQVIYRKSRSQQFDAVYNTNIFLTVKGILKEGDV